MTSPAFLENVEAEERSELEGLTGILAQPLDDAGLDALASHALRIMGREQAEIDRYQRASDAEVDRINARYAAFIQPHGQYRAQAEETVKECAKRAQFVGKGKSRKVGNGVYGKKLVPERVSIVDKVQALAFAKMFGGPDAVKVKTEETVVHAVVAPIVIAQLHATSALPNGFEHVGEHEEYFGKPLSVEGE